MAHSVYRYSWKSQRRFDVIQQLVEIYGKHASEEVTLQLVKS